ncbi:MAG: hypothetical protein C0432_02880 [Candidatus Puniceispirillum sp.]|nr:hypothetical protein [Candidatus Pelagibacter sp.]MBA4283221.1 hypothetical protein [Candidatus Puniceispirillum sp.]
MKLENQTIIFLMLTQIIYSLIQGIAETFPISSSAHIFLTDFFSKKIPFLANKMTPLPAEIMPLLDVCLHMGSFFAIIIYFRKTLWKIVSGVFSGIFKLQHTPGLSGLLMIIMATIPTIIVGYFSKKYFKIPITLLSLGIAFVVFGLLHMISEKMTTPEDSVISFRQAIIIGVAQVLALVPGSSRLGVCVTASRFLKIKPWQGIEFAFILSLPVLLGAASLSTYDFYKTGGNLQLVLNLWPIIAGTFIVNLMMFPILRRLVMRFSLFIFGLYRFLLGSFLIYYSYFLMK